MSYMIGATEVPATATNVAPAAVKAQSDAKQEELRKAKSGGGTALLGSGGVGTLLVLAVVGAVGYHAYKKRKKGGGAK